MKRIRFMEPPEKKRLDPNKEWDDYFLVETPQEAIEALLSGNYGERTVAHLEGTFAHQRGVDVPKGWSVTKATRKPVEPEEFEDKPEPTRRSAIQVKRSEAPPSDPPPEPNHYDKVLEMVQKRAKYRAAERCES